MKSEVTATLFPTDTVPKFASSKGGTRRSDIEDALELVAEENPVGVPVCIRQYQKKDSASGTLYNLRHRPHVHQWEFAIGPLDDFGEEYKGQTGLWATRLA